jgi:DNA polymerase III alpha subunit
MKVDIYGQHIFTEDDIADLYLSDPERKIKNILVEDRITISDILDLESVPKILLYNDPNLSVEEFDKIQQNNWNIPESYKDFDIAKYVLDLCETEVELQRVGQELLMYQERDMFPLLIYLKYLVDVMRENNIVWGVGRGSSVSSYVLFLLGIHRINSIFYDLSIDEFLR